MKVVAKNKRAFYDFDIVDTLEAGLQLTGSEVKSVKSGHVSLKGGYVRFIGGELFLTNAHISHYGPATHTQHDELRDRKLLIHARERDELRAMQQNGRHIIPLKIYLVRGLVKIEIGIGPSRKKHDKRERLKRRDHDREIARKLKR